MSDSPTFRDMYNTFYYTRSKPEFSGRLKESGALTTQRGDWTAQSPADLTPVTERLERGASNVREREREIYPSLCTSRDLKVRR